VLQSSAAALTIFFAGRNPFAPLTYSRYATALRCNIYFVPGKPIILLFFLLLIGVSSPHTTVSAQELHFQNFTTKDGLPSVQVYNMYQDVNGFMWFATDRGICRYNGYAFETFGLKDGLTSNTVFNFYPQDNGDVWCSTLNNRFFIFNPTDYVFRKYPYNDILARHAADAINDDLYIGRNGTVHVGFINMSGVLSIDSGGHCTSPVPRAMSDVHEIVLEELPGGKTFSYIQPPTHGKAVQREVLAQVKVRSSALAYHKVAHRGNITLISDEHQVFLMQEGELLHTINNGEQPLGVGFFDDGHIWISTQYGGVTIYDMQGKAVQHYLKGRSVTWLLADHEGGFWISTLSAGVFYTQSLQFRHAVLDSDPTIHNLTNDGEGRLIASLYNGNAYRYKEGAFELWYQSGDHKPSHVQFYDSLNTVLGYFDAKVTGGNGQDELFGNVYVTKFSDDSKEAPLLAGTKMFYTYLNNRIQGYAFERRIYDVCQAAGGALLATTHGVYHYDTTNRRGVKLQEELLDCRVTDIDQFQQGLKLAATHGNGVVVLAEDSVWAITRKDGLSSDLINEVYVQDDSTFWACTNAGLSRVQLNSDGTYGIASLTTSDGLLDNDITDVEVVDGVVWVGTRSGLSSFPMGVMDEDTVLPVCFLQILDVRVNGERGSDLSNLSHRQNRLQVDFQAISFKANADLLYRYQLSGLENQWNYTATPQIIYKSLPPGDFTFVLQAGVGGRWSNEVRSLQFTVFPPFYETGWFRLLAMVLIVLLVYWFFKIRILTYNRDITRELLRQLLKRLKRKTDHFVVRDRGHDVRISSRTILYVKSAGNYIEIHTEARTYVIRATISSFMGLVPDPLEYLRVHRSYIVRIDKVRQKSINSVTVRGTEIDVGHTYLKVLAHIKF